jgi:hypothetical protein
MSFLDGEESSHSFFVTNAERSPEKAVDFYQKRGNSENYIKEAIFQLMVLAYNLFLLFKIDMVKTTEYRQQIKTFRLKYIFLDGKIVRTARRAVMKPSERYPYREIYEHCLSG